MGSTRRNLHVSESRPSSNVPGFGANFGPFRRNDFSNACERLSFRERHGRVSRQQAASVDGSRHGFLYPVHGRGASRAGLAKSIREVRRPRKLKFAKAEHNSATPAQAYKGARPAFRKHASVATSQHFLFAARSHASNAACQHASVATSARGRRPSALGHLGPLGCCAAKEPNCAAAASHLAARVATGGRHTRRDLSSGPGPVLLHGH